MVSNVNVDETRPSLASHTLKTRPSFFKRTAIGEKNFEIRYNGDRHFQNGDEVILVHWDPGQPAGEETGLGLIGRIGFVTNFNQSADTVVFAVLDIKRCIVSSSPCFNVLEGAPEDLDDLQKRFLYPRFIEDYPENRPAPIPLTDDTPAKYEH